jgi:hypothetical protein
MRSNAGQTAKGRTSFGHLRRHWHAEVPIGAWPVEVTHTGSLFAGLFIMVFGAVWGGFPVFGMTQHGAPDLSRPENWLFLAFPVIGVGIVLYGLHRLLWRKTVTLDGLFVAVAQRGLFGAKSWQEPLTAYRGVLSRTRRVSTKNSHYTLYLVELLHDDSKRTINLYTARRQEGWRAKWEAYARWLKLPALEEGEGGVVAREIEDLDKSVAELIDEGKVAVDYDILRQRAEGLAVDIEGDTVVATRTRPQVSLLGTVLFLAFPAAFLYIGFFLGEGEAVDEMGRRVVGAMGVLFGVLILAGLVWDRLTRRRLRIAPDRLTVTTIGPWGEGRGRSLDAGEVEGVRVAREHDNRRPAVLIEGDRQTLTFGRGLPEASLEFLANLALAKIAKHHGRSP